MIYDLPLRREVAHRSKTDEVVRSIFNKYRKAATPHPPLTWSPFPSRGRLGKGGADKKTPIKNIIIPALCEIKDKFEFLCDIVIAYSIKS